MFFFYHRGIFKVSFEVLKLGALRALAARVSPELFKAVKIQTAFL